MKQDTDLKTIIITGSNKGIGYGLAHNLASLNQWRIIMACRNLELAHQSRHQIISQFPSANLIVEKLDISSRQSIEEFVGRLKVQNIGVDILVNNAGVKRQKYDHQSFKFTFETNFYGTVELSEKMLPLLKHSGKIIIVGSKAGKLGNLVGEQIRQRFRDPELNMQKLMELVREYEQSVIEGNSVEKGFYKRIYGVSKASINQYARVLSFHQTVKQKQIQVYALCPGYVATDMCDYKGDLTIEEGIQTPLFLIKLPFEVNKEYQGQFFEKGALSTVEGEFHSEAEKYL